MPILGLDHVQLAIAPGTEAACRAFWTALGFDEVEKPAALAGRGGLWLRGGTAMLHLGLQDPPQAARKAHPAFTVTDLGALRQRLERLGVPVREDAPFDGRPRLFCDDPAGNRIEFIEGAAPS